VDKLEGVLRDMFANFENWTDMGAFDPLTDVARGLLVDCGITISLQPNKSMHVRVSPAKVW
jgi:hypothetical protein